MSSKRVIEVMSKDGLSVRPDDTLETVGAKMRQFHVSGFPVIDDFGALCGVVTEKDLGRGLTQGKASSAPTSFLDILAHGHAMEDTETLAVLRARFRRMHVDAVMSRNPTVVSADTTVEEAGRLIARLGLHRLPVVDRGKVVGVISYQEILQALTSP